MYSWRNLCSRQSMPRNFIYVAMLLVLIICDLALAYLPSPFTEYDQADNLVSVKFRSIMDMEQNKLREGKIKADPWSGKHWPLYLGGIAARMEDDAFPRSRNWQGNVDYLLANLGQVRKIAQLSPAEKYDLLV